jgi:hypothetical protein
MKGNIRKTWKYVVECTHLRWISEKAVYAIVYQLLSLRLDWCGVVK